MIHISKISLKNFKSFKRVSLPIPKGFTAIVGPNGSGKSNIVDAICFVLGRSSAKSLRAERFADLIFNGGKGGEPAQEAEVSMYLDNTPRDIPFDSKEIKITRIVDKTGNSVYKLNGKRTSRTDILDLISAGNIYPDGHNIILQGDITRIIEMNPSERREIIDTIAGIAEYDDKKKKAVRELEKVSENIEKANAVFDEVRVQMEKLEKEKADAQRHEFLSREVRQKKAMVIHSKHLEVKENIEDLTEKIQEGNQKLEKARRYLEILDQKLETKTVELEKSNQNVILKEQTDHSSAIRELEQVKGRLKICEDKLHSLGKESNSIEERINNIKGSMLDIDSKKKKSKEELETLMKKETETAGELNSKGEEIKGLYKKVTELSSLNSDKKEKLNEILPLIEEKRNILNKNENELELLGDKKSEKERNLHEMEGDLENRKTSYSNEISNMEKSSQRIEAIQKFLKESTMELGELGDKIRKNREKYNQLLGELDEKTDEFKKQNAQFKLMEEVKKGRGGLNRAVEEILVQRDMGEPGIFGTVAELGRVNPKFSKALAVAAGNGMTHIVVDNDRTAERCINYLKENKIGRATFLPLNKIREFKHHPNSVEPSKKSHGYAIDLVKYDKKFEKAFGHVFRSTIVVEDISFARSIGIGLTRMVTLDGDLVDISGAMTGGIYRPHGGISFEAENQAKEKMETLGQEIRSLMSLKESLAAKIDELKDKEEKLKLRKFESEKEMEILEEKIETLTVEKGERKANLSSKEAAIKELKNQIKEFEKIIEKNKPALDGIKDEFEKLMEKKSRIEDDLRESGLDEILGEIKQREKDVLELEKLLQETGNNIKFIETKQEEILASKMVELRNEIVSLVASKRTLKEDIQENVAKNNELLHQLKMVEDKENQIKIEISFLNERKRFFIKGMELIKKKIKSLEASKNRYSKMIELKNMELARNEARLEEITKDLKEFLDIPIDLLAPIETEEFEREISFMESEMKSLEPINMRAIEDYDTIKEKFDKFDLRIGKLESEKDSIQHLMDEIEHRKFAIFMEVFENVAMNFRRIFSRLSPGGAADLVLNDERPLDGGMQIKAKPSGKNPQYIELMSGGEKTLTALSFIFAIQKFQPAPFYILDEIDMFLDDANVKLISELVKESAEGAQFIVVSLRDNMMTSAQQLFGVSNKEGISRIVGVELEDVRV